MLDTVILNLNLSTHFVNNSRQLIRLIDNISDLYEIFNDLESIWRSAF